MAELRFRRWAGWATILAVILAAVSVGIFLDAVSQRPIPGRVATPIALIAIAAVSLLVIVARFGVVWSGARTDALRNALLAVGTLVGAVIFGLLINQSHVAEQHRIEKLRQEYASVPASDLPRPGEPRCEWTGLKGEEPRCPRRATLQRVTRNRYGREVSRLLVCGVHAKGP